MTCKIYFNSEDEELSHGRGLFMYGKIIGYQDKTPIVKINNEVYDRPRKYLELKNIILHSGQITLKYRDMAHFKGDIINDILTSGYVPYGTQKKLVKMLKIEPIFKKKYMYYSIDLDFMDEGVKNYEIRQSNLPLFLKNFKLPKK